MQNTVAGGGIAAGEKMINEELVGKIKNGEVKVQKILPEGGKLLTIKQ